MHVDDGAVPVAHESEDGMEGVVLARVGEDPVSERAIRELPPLSLSTFVGLADVRARRLDIGVAVVVRSEDGGDAGGCDAVVPEDVPVPLLAVCSRVLNRDTASRNVFVLHGL